MQWPTDLKDGKEGLAFLYRNVMFNFINIDYISHWGFSKQTNKNQTNKEKRKKKDV